MTSLRSMTLPLRGVDDDMTKPVICSSTCSEIMPRSGVMECAHGR